MTPYLLAARLALIFIPFPRLARRLGTFDIDGSWRNDDHLGLQADLALIRRGGRWPEESFSCGVIQKSAPSPAKIRLQAMQLWINY
jgi:hypothetical protein